jgi:hypothetical protein
MKCGGYICNGSITINPDVTKYPDENTSVSVNFTLNTAYTGGNWTLPPGSKVTFTFGGTTKEFTIDTVNDPRNPTQQGSGGDMMGGMGGMMPYSEAAAYAVGFPGYTGNSTGGMGSMMGGMGQMGSMLGYPSFGGTGNTLGVGGAAGFGGMTGMGGSMEAIMGQMGGMNQYGQYDITPYLMTVPLKDSIFIESTGKNIVWDCTATINPVQVQGSADGTLKGTVTSYTTNLPITSKEISLPGNFSNLSTFLSGATEDNPRPENGLYCASGIWTKASDGESLLGNSGILLFPSAAVEQPGGLQTGNIRNSFI